MRRYVLAVGLLLTLVALPGASADAEAASCSVSWDDDGWPDYVNFGCTPITQCTLRLDDATWPVVGYCTL